MKTASIYLLTILVLGLVASPALQHAAQNQDNKDNSNLFGANAFAESDEGDSDTNDAKNDNSTNTESQDESDGEDQGTDQEDSANEDDSSANEDDSSANEDDSSANEDDSSANEDDSSANEDDSSANDLDAATNQAIVQKSDDLVLQLQQKIDQLEQRLQSLLEKLQTGQYYGDISQPDSEIKSYDISFDGTATSLSDDSAQNVKAKFVIENLSTKDYIATFKVTGGQVQIGQTTYDLAFGKIRIMSDHTAKDSILLIGNLIDEQGNSNGIRLSISSAQSLDGDFGQQPIDLTVVQPSKIAGQWLLEGNGKLSLS